MSDTDAGVPADNTELHADDLSIDKRVFLTLDLECDYGTALQNNSYQASQATDKLAELLESFDVPLTCFLQTEMVTEAPEAVDHLAAADVPVEFHPHSHTHPRHSASDVEFEVQESVKHVRDQFSTSPVGFRFPDGAIDDADYQVLAKHDVSFSSSVFPSLRPGRFNNLDQPRRPFRHQASGILELPFTVFSNYVPIPVALSYLKLFGAPFEWLTAKRPPSLIVFDFHMHDLVVPPAFDQLSAPYKLIYSRNKHRGFEILRDFITNLQAKGYTFEPISTLYTAVSDDLQ
jgi:peptidoglycan/xylan/chitin deacetylase (PgdA/CDA1 family)